MKVLIFGGFLGAGKTSVITQMAHYLVCKDPGAMSHIVLLENEIGDTGIDDKTLSGTGMKVETLFSGCICCTMAGELVENMQYIQKKFGPEWVIIETTGIAYPNKVKKTLTDAFPGMEIHDICLVDAKRWGRMQKVPELREFSKAQLSGASVVLVNKCDLVEEKDLWEVDSSVQEINDKPKIFHVIANKQITDDIWNQIFAWNGEEKDDG
jgi:G3E family GTPase